MTIFYQKSPVSYLIKLNIFIIIDNITQCIQNRTISFYGCSFVIKFNSGDCYGMTIAGAISGEIASLRRRRVHNLRQKDRKSNK